MSKPFTYPFSKWSPQLCIVSAYTCAVLPIATSDLLSHYCMESDIYMYEIRVTIIAQGESGNKLGYTWLVNSISLYLRDLLGLITRKEAVPRKLCRKALKPGSNAH